MARSGKSRNKKPVVIEPRYSLGFVAAISTGFVLFCLLLPRLLVNHPSGRSSNNNSIANNNSSVATKKVFIDRSDIPDELLSTIDAIIILGASLTDNKHPSSARCCDDAAALVARGQSIRTFRSENRNPTKTTTTTKTTTDSLSSNTDNENEKNPIPILCLSTSNYLPQGPPLDGDHQDHNDDNGIPSPWDSLNLAHYLSKTHNLVQNVYVETTSFDIIGNAFYTRSSFTEINDWRRLLIIAPEFHIDGTRLVFDWIFSLDKTTSPRGKDLKHDDYYDVYYLASKVVGLNNEKNLAVSKGWERQRLIALQDHFIPKYSSMKAVWSFLHHDPASLYMTQKRIHNIQEKQPSQQQQQEKNIRDEAGEGPPEQEAQQKEAFGETEVLMEDKNYSATGESIILESLSSTEEL